MMIRKRTGILIFGVLAVVITFIAIVSGNFFTKKIQIEIGQVAKETFLAPFQVENEIATNRKRDLAEENVKTQYKKDSKVQEQAISHIEQLFDTVKSLRAEMSETHTEAEIVSLLNDQTTIALYNEQYRTLLYMPEARLDEMQEVCIQEASALFEAGISEADLNKTFTLRNALGDSALTLPQQKLVQDIINSVLAPNVVIDEVATKAAITAEREKVEPVYVLAGETIIEQGSRVTEETYKLLEKVGYLNTDKSELYKKYLGLIILLVLATLFTLYYMVSYRKKWSYTQYNFILLTYSVAVLMVRGLMSLNFVYIPMGIVAMLIAFTMEVEIALLVQTVLVIVTALILKCDFISILYFLITGIGSIFIIHKMLERAKTFSHGFLVGFLQMITYISLKLFTGALLNIELVSTGFIAFVIGMLSVILVVGVLPFFESLFSLMTPMQLLELTNPNQPILKRLLLEATGTYYHSLLVANLAESAADAIGANPLMARVGGYYHDIGKLSGCMYFKENQGNENPHDYLTAYESYECIVKHVSEGVKLATAYELPPYIIDIIKQHHGTSCMQYFYVKAREEQGVEIEEKRFCYPGPKPRTKEAALVMLADVVEATVRAMQDKIGKDLSIEDLVTKMVKQKLNEGQLDECELYISDIDKIIESFTKMLKGMYHERIKYPERTER